MNKLTKSIIFGSASFIGLIASFCLSIFTGVKTVHQSTIAYDYFLNNECDERKSGTLISKISAENPFEYDLSSSIKNEVDYGVEVQAANGIEGISIVEDGVTLFNNASIIETSSYTRDFNYNMMRVISNDTWGMFKNELADNVCCIGRTTSQKLLDLTHRTYEVNKTITLSIYGENVDFKIVGIFEDDLSANKNNRFRKIGECFEDAFNECIFVKESYMETLKPNMVVTQMSFDSTHSNRNGEIYEKINNFANKNSLNLTIDACDQIKSASMKETLSSINNFFENQSKTIISIFLILASIVCYAGTAALIVFFAKNFELKNAKWNSIACLGIALLIAFAPIFLTAISKRFVSNPYPNVFISYNNPLSILFVFFEIVILLVTFLIAKKEAFKFFTQGEYVDRVEKYSTKKEIETSTNEENNQESEEEK